MANDEVAICNRALSRIGVTTKIPSLDVRTKEAIELNAVFEDVRDAVLAAAHWPFARKIIALQKTGEAPFRWLYRYEYPNDCVAIRFLYPPISGGRDAEGFRLALQENPIKYEIGLDENNAQTICTDTDLAVIEYTARVKNPRQFDAKFSSALAWALAAEVALPLAKTLDHSRNALAMYEKEISEAIAKALNEERSDPPPESEFVLARL
ncbi:hypothetical protein [Geobacter sp. SVR]|uniref:hypothetical protein n=1 Tax=Geobacter sp. SVR TaxID=2495594 RepID=UPI00143EF567|nr:hypothetical protein [Geobacter sp. SVR]BCS54781.1 hypothetical protein GSVR_30890 [Geobacter sp. SVR]GCF86411.1 hypothetical protein GSbR_30110 [Geobacter sp. SVR]